MYRVVICRKNTDSFVKWFTRQSLDTRVFVLHSYSCFLQERGLSLILPAAVFTPFRKQPLSVWRLFASWLFGELASWDIRQFVYYEHSKEVVFDFHPFAFWSGRKSEFLERRRIQDSYLTL